MYIGIVFLPPSGDQKKKKSLHISRGAIQKHFENSLYKTPSIFSDTTCRRHISVTVCCDIMNVKVLERSKMADIPPKTLSGKKTKAKENKK